MTDTKPDSATAKNKSRRKPLDIFLNTALVLMLGWYGYTYHGLLYASTEVKKESNAQVIMYSTKWCPSCIQARAFFAKNKIPYRSYDINESEEYKNQLINLGGRGVPLFIIKNKVIHGLRKERLAKLLNIK